MEDTSRLTVLFDQNGLPLKPEEAERLVAFAALFGEWNARINLMSRASLPALLPRHLVDCALPLPLLPEQPPLVDLGSGGGLPGIVLAILRPEWEITLAETKEKKIKFLLDCVSRLNLQRVTVVNPSREKPQRRHRLLVSRAFGSLTEILHEARRYLLPGGMIAAYKGRRETLDAELTGLPGRGKIRIIPYRFVCPEENAERHLVLLPI
jgi:16S rRNA (guanine527-N7)-methyltransferase